MAGPLFCAVKTVKQGQRVHSPMFHYVFNEAIEAARNPEPRQTDITGHCGKAAPFVAAESRVLGPGSERVLGPEAQREPNPSAQHPEPSA